MQVDLEILFICVGLGATVAWTLIPLVRQLAFSRGWVKQEKSFHHTHKTPVPRLGGIGLAAAFIPVSIFGLLLADPSRLNANLSIFLCSFAMFAMGLWDDFRPVGAKVKLLAQVAIAVAAYTGGLRIEYFTNPLTGQAGVQLGLWSLPATVFWLVAMTNLINLIDGIDGLAGGIALLLMCLLAYVGVQEYIFPTIVAMGMAGALLGFLRWNFPPAKIYMGDGGAYFLGFLIGSLTIVTSHKGTVAAALVAPVFALALPITDVLLAITRRGLKGLPIFRPDRQHIHHRLVDLGFSRRRAVLILYALSVVCFFMALGVLRSQGRLVPLLIGVLFLMVLAAARVFGYIKDWWQILKLMGNSLQLRKESRYALATMTWLELDAERCETLQELWTSYLFVTRKLGFSQVRPVLARENGSVEPLETPSLDSSRFRWQRQEVRLSNLHAIEFVSHAEMSPNTFAHLAELAAEAWLKAARRWQETNGHQISFEPALPQIKPTLAPGKVFVANAA